MQVKFPILVLLSLYVLISSCEKEQSVEFTDSPIIESYLKPGDLLNLSVSRQIPFASDVTYSQDDINNLDIRITVNDISHKLQALGNGKYVDSTLIVSENDNYQLLFSFNSKLVKAFTYVPSKPTNLTQSASVVSIQKVDITAGGPPPNIGVQPEPVVVSWDNPDRSNYLIIVENIETDPEAIRNFGDATPPGNIFRKQPNSTTSEEIRANEFQYFGWHRIIVHHVLPDYASLYNASSTSSQNLSNPSTSISNGYGIFTGLNSDTLMVLVKKQ